jgi:outer membrane lipoprotein carrier protein
MGAPCPRRLTPRPWGYSLFFLLSAIALPAQQNEALLNTVDAHYNHLSSLRTRYVERYTGMGLTRSETGTLTLKKPGRMRWAYDSPAGKVFILDGKFAWFYTPGDPQVQRISAKQMDDLRTPLRFLLGHTQLKKELYEISISPAGTNFRIAGIPKGMEQRVKELSLVVTPAGAIVEMKVEEIDGATTEFTFSDGQENVPAKDSDFIFTPPAGVAIVNGGPPL